MEQPRLAVAEAVAAVAAARAADGLMWAPVRAAVGAAQRARGDGLARA